MSLLWPLLPSSSIPPQGPHSFLSSSPRSSPELQAIVQLLIRTSKCKLTHSAWSPALLLSSSAPYVSNWHHHFSSVSWMPSFKPFPSWKVTSLFPLYPQVFSSASVSNFLFLLSQQEEYLTPSPSALPCTWMSPSCSFHLAVNMCCSLGVPGLDAVSQLLVHSTQPQAWHLVVAQKSS